MNGSRKSQNTVAVVTTTTPSRLIQLLERWISGARRLFEPEVSSPIRDYRFRHRARSLPGLSLANKDYSQREWVKLRTCGEARTNELFEPWPSTTCDVELVAPPRFMATTTTLRLLGSVIDFTVLVLVKLKLYA